MQRASRGEEIIIARSGRPLARLGPLSAARRRRPGLLKGRIHVTGNFDAPLPRAVLEAFAPR